MQIGLRDLAGTEQPRQLLQAQGACHRTARNHKYSAVSGVVQAGQNALKGNWRDLQPKESGANHCAAEQPGWTGRSSATWPGTLSMNRHPLAASAPRASPERPGTNRRATAGGVTEIDHRSSSDPFRPPIFALLLHVFAPPSAPPLASDDQSAAELSTALFSSRCTT